MPHVSRRKLSKNTDKLLDNLLKHVFVNLKPHESEKILSVLLTKTEKVMISKRSAVIYFSNNDQSDDDISSFIKLTRQTIYRIKDHANTVPKYYISLMMKKVSLWTKLNALKNALQDFLDTPRDKFLRVKKYR